MGDKRLLYRNWILNLGHTTTGGRDSTNSNEENHRANIIHERVLQALAKLATDERFCVERRDYDGLTFREIAEISGRSPRRWQIIHERAFRKLRKELSPTVSELFGVPTAAAFIECPLCRSPRRNEIDMVIAGRDRTRPWKPIIRTLKQEFGVRVSTPQQLIGHEKYH